jgi:hypothetical protein
MFLLLADVSSYDGITSVWGCMSVNFCFSFFIFYWMFYCCETAFGFPIGDLLFAYWVPYLPSFLGVLRYLPSRPFMTMLMNFWSYPRVVKYSMGEKSWFIWVYFLRCKMPVSKVLCFESKSEIFLSSSVSLPLGGLRLF